MIFSVKFKTIAWVAAFILVVVCLSWVFSAAASSVPYNGKTVVLDAGHGGRDGGVVGASTGSKESDINLAIVKAAESFLTAKGYRVVLTRKNSEGLYGVFSKNKKLADMEKRRQIIEDARPDLVVSIHQNSYPGARTTGPQVFYSPDSDEEKSKQIAQSVQSTLNSALSGKRVAAKGDYYILECTKFPSVLIECGFLSNPEEERLLVSAEYQQRLAYAVFSAVHLILNEGGLSGLLYE